MKHALLRSSKLAVIWLQINISQPDDECNNTHVNLAEHERWATDHHNSRNFKQGGRNAVTLIKAGCDMDQYSFHIQLTRGTTLFYHWRHQQRSDFNDGCVDNPTRQNGCDTLQIGFTAKMTDRASTSATSFIKSTFLTKKTQTNAATMLEYIFGSMCCVWLLNAFHQALRLASSVRFALKMPAVMTG